MRHGLCLGAALLVIAACGGASSPSEGGHQANKSADCPPTQKGNGILVSSRYDYEDLLEANKWRTDMFPRSCAGTLADLVPDLPAGYGVMPTSKPYIMKDDQVYLGFAALSEPLYTDEGWPNLPRDLELVEFEIVRFSSDEIQIVRDWMAAYPENYMTSTLNGEEIYLMGGMASGRRGKGDRLTGGLTAIFDSGLVIRLTHKDLYSQRGTLEISGLVETLMSDMLERAKRAGY